MKRHYTISQSATYWFPNVWDGVALVLLFALCALVAWGTDGINRPYAVGESLPIYLDPAYLPRYGIRTAIRMGLALGASLIFSLVMGAWAAKHKRAEQIIIPMIDILQSVPILGFLSFTLVWFIQLFPNSLWGPECAAIFVIFTSQAWNITLGFYQSLKTVPSEMREAGRIFHLSPWQIFWRVEVPYALPSLLWNMMVSVSAGWFFIIVSEAISVADHDITLPGIGSYMAKAIAHSDKLSMVYGIGAMFTVIVLYDQLLFRPLVKWSERFQTGETDDTSHQPWIFLLLKRTRWVQRLGTLFGMLFYFWVHLPDLRARRISRLALPVARKEHPRTPNRWRDGMGKGILWLLWFGLALGIGQQVVRMLPGFLTHFSMAHPPDISTMRILSTLQLGGYTLLRIVVLIGICSVIWVPIGVWIGLRPRFAGYAQAIAQLLAAIPANLFYPLAVIMILRWDLNTEIWISPLMVLGTQWYIVFNVIAGASQLPRELLQVAENFNVRGWLWWKRFALPAIFPYYVTGAMAAAGGAWNSSIVAEIIHWGPVTLKATGLGAFISDATVQGEFGDLALGIFIMCCLVTIINRLFWKPLFDFACARFQFHA